MMKIMNLTAFKLMMLGLIIFSPMAHAKNETWFAGTRYKGQLTIPMGNQTLLWKCNGSVCRVSGSFTHTLSLEACQALVKRTGPLRFFKNTQGKIWTYNSKELAECNKAAR